ncbi:helix-turn-helix domain-containing protein (plasmid) [Tistrella bauzanensis]|uniref:Cyclic nucleotide-binding domain-containing protein n=1 Tax=Tistrella arctica TaxID=3133430 RepID=A0ABU9YKN7_9PROT
MRPNDLPDIRDLPLFRSMDEASFAELMNAAYLQKFPRQVDLIFEGEPADFLYVVIEGCVELFSRHAGRETTLGMVVPVSSFILAAVIRDAAYLMSGRTTEASRILMIPSENIRAIFEKDGAFARAIVRELALDFRVMIKEYKNLKLRPGIERLANRLLRLHDQTAAAGSFMLPYDKKTLASILGMTPENLSRGFATLKAYGVDVSGNMITITDVDDLRAFAKVNPFIDQ